MPTQAPIERTRRTGREPATEEQHGGTDSGPGLIHRREPPVDAVALVDAGDHAPTDLWRALASASGFTRTLVDAVRTLVADCRGHTDRALTLYDAGATAADGGYARLAAGFDRGPETPAFELAGDVTAQFGTGEVTAIGRLGLDALDDGPLALLDAVDATPTIAVKIDEAFRERRRNQREATCALLARLSCVCTVAVCATGLTARWLAHEHGEQFPREFSERCNTRGTGSPDVDDRVTAAREALDPDGRAVQVLHDLDAEPASTLSYHELRAVHGDVSQSRISQLVGRLADLDLVEKYGQRGDQQVDLLPAGSAYLDAVETETDRQRRLDADFSGTGQSSHRDVLTRPHGRAAGDAPHLDEPAGASAGPFRTRYLDRADHHAAAAAAGAGDVTAVNGPLPGDCVTDEHRTRFVSYDADRDEAVVAVRATTPLQYMTSVALGLASPRFLEAALPADRLDEIEDPPAILRDARCIGALSTEALDDGETLREALVEWGREIADMTTDLRHGEHEDRERLCGAILRSAHGLTGSIVHLLDVAGVDIIRELRVPSLSDEQLADLARTVSVATAIQSRYGAFTGYRQLFEDRDEKRQTALTPDVDATDPVGSYIGCLVLRGPRADRLGYHVEGAVSEPAPLHEDAPEFAVEVTVATPGRRATTDAVTRMLATKNMRPTSEAVTLFDALAADVFAVTEAIRWLGTEDAPRTVRLDEVRVALANLDAGRLLRDAPPTLSKAVGALLATARPCSRQTLADEADVSVRSLRRHLDALVALDLVRVTDEGYRLTLPFKHERGQQIAPEPVTDETPRPDTLAFEAVLELLPAEDCGRLADPSDPVGQQFCGPGFDPGPLRTHLPRSNPYLRVVTSLCRTTDSGLSTVRFGPAVEQTPLATTGTDEVTA